MDLIVRFRVSEEGEILAPRLVLIGPSQRPSHVPCEQGDCFFGLRFRAGWGGACLGLAPASLRDSALRGDAAAKHLGPDATLLLSAGRMPVLQARMVALAGRRAQRATGIAGGAMDALNLMHLSAGRLTLTEVARLVDVPERSLRRQITAAVGLPYKAFGSVLRFQWTLRLLSQAGSTSPLTLAQAAAEGGYSDQAHMTREFRRHGGFTPGRRQPATLVGLPLGTEADAAEIFKTRASGAAYAGAH